MFFCFCRWGSRPRRGVLVASKTFFCACCPLRLTPNLPRPTKPQLRLRRICKGVGGDERRDLIAVRSRDPGDLLGSKRAAFFRSCRFPFTKEGKRLFSFKVYVRPTLFSIPIRVGLESALNRRKFDNAEYHHVRIWVGARRVSGDASFCTMTLYWKSVTVSSSDEAGRRVPAHCVPVSLFCNFCKLYTRFQIGSECLYVAST